MGARESSYEKEIADFRANPDAYAEESSSEESSSSDSDSDSDSSSEDDDDSSSEEESDSDSDGDGSDGDGSDDDSDASSAAGGAPRGVGEAKASKPVKTQKVMEWMRFVWCSLRLLLVCGWRVLWVDWWSGFLLAFLCGWGPGVSWVASRFAVDRWRAAVESNVLLGCAGRAL